MRNSALTSKLDRISDSISGLTVVDPQGYLTSLNSIKITSEAEIGDIKKARVLLQSVTSTNPNHGPGWIAAARVEEYANKLANARKVILEGCEKASHSEDVWLEAARLHPATTAKVILTNAIKAIPHSVKLYLELAGYEDKAASKKVILRKGLEAIPNSVTLWKAAIELENIVDAKVLLVRAIECIPTNVDMYLALAKLETHGNARKVLNMARENIPTERKVWIYAATLEEVNANAHLVAKIIEKMMFSLAQYEVIVKREDWLSEAVTCEANGALLTCHAILLHTLHLGIEKEDYRRIWLDDIHTVLYNPAQYGGTVPGVHTARGIVQVVLQHFPNKKAVWLQAILVEQDFGNADTVFQRLQEACLAVPGAEILWLMHAKERWKAGDVQQARSVLMQAYEHNPHSEAIYLAAIKLEWECGELQRTQRLLEKALEVIGSPKIFLKYALLELERGDVTHVLELLEQGLKKYPHFEKFYLMAGQVYTAGAAGAGDRTPAEGGAGSNGAVDVHKARLLLQTGLKHCPSCAPLWKALLQLEEADKGVVKARSIGEMARLKLPKHELIYLECLRLERRHHSTKLYTNLLSKALIDCPTSGLLYSELLLHVPKTQYKSRSLEALKKLPNNEHVLLAVGRLFERSYNFPKACKYYERALAVNSRQGDVYVFYYACVYVRAHKQALVNAGSQAAAAAEGEDVLHYQEVLRAVEAPKEDLLIMEGVDDDDEQQQPVAVAVAAGDDAAAAAAAEASPALVKAAAPMLDTLLTSLRQRCETSEPNSGELWCSLTKQTQLRRKSVQTKLIACVQQVLGFDLLPDTF